MRIFLFSKYAILRVACRLRLNLAPGSHWLRQPAATYRNGLNARETITTR